MQGIDRLVGTMRATASRRAARGGAGGFRLEAEEAGAPHEAVATGGIAPAGLGLLALQEAGSGAERDAAAQRRAVDILEELNALQCDMLGGPPVDPARLRRLLDSGEEGADPGLQEVVRGVVLRAQVELMRRGLLEAASIA